MNKIPVQLSACVRTHANTYANTRVDTHVYSCRANTNTCTHPCMLHMHKQVCTTTDSVQDCRLSVHIRCTRTHLSWVAEDHVVVVHTLASVRNTVGVKFALYPKFTVECGHKQFSVGKSNLVDKSRAATEKHQSPREKSPYLKRANKFAQSHEMQLRLRLQQQ